MVDRAWQLAKIGEDHFKPRILSNRAGDYALGRIHEVLGDDLLAAQWSLRTGNATTSLPVRMAPQFRSSSSESTRTQSVIR